MEMNLHNKLRVALALLALTAVAAAPALAWDEREVAEGQFERTLNVSGPVDLSVHTNSGSITVTPGSGSQVRILGKIKVRRDRLSDAQAIVKEIESNPPIEQAGNTIRIGRQEREEESREWRRNVSISYELVVPKATRVNSNTGSGSQSVSGIDGPLDATTGSGSLTLSSIGGEVTASTGSGSIKIDGANGRLRANTGSGSIRATGVAGAITASTGSGSVELEQVAAGDVDASTGSGGIEARGVKGRLRVRTGSGTIRADGAPTGDWSLHTSSGSIYVRLPVDAAFELDAETSSGSINSAHPVTVVGTLSKRRLQGKVRGGGFRLAVSTSSGSIRVE
jgi:DUF4097 and DUF4098 domain-containing protein YvlB